VILVKNLMIIIVNNCLFLQPW